MEYGAGLSKMTECQIICDDHWSWSIEAVRNLANLPYVHNNGRSARGGHELRPFMGHLQTFSARWWLRSTWNRYGHASTSVREQCLAGRSMVIKPALSAPRSWWYFETPWSQASSPLPST